MCRFQWISLQFPKKFFRNIGNEFPVQYWGFSYKLTGISTEVSRIYFIIFYNPALSHCSDPEPNIVRNSNVAKVFIYGGIFSHPHEINNKSTLSCLRNACSIELLQHSIWHDNAPSLKSEAEQKSKLDLTMTPNSPTSQTRYGMFRVTYWKILP